MALHFYDSKGEPVAYSDDREHIYLFSGEPAAYFVEDCVYDYEGRHLGWFQDGWILDHEGDYVYFTEESKGEPFKKQIKKMLPLKNMKLLQPMKKMRMMKSPKPMRTLAWTLQSGDAFFLNVKKSSK